MAKQPLDQECATCSAWITNGTEQSDGRGECKAHPPAPLFGANLKQPGSGVPKLVFVFPVTAEHDWCRDYKMETPSPPIVNQSA